MKEDGVNGVIIKKKKQPELVYLIFNFSQSLFDFYVIVYYFMFYVFMFILFSILCASFICSVFVIIKGHL